MLIFSFLRFTSAKQNGLVKIVHESVQLTVLCNQNRGFKNLHDMEKEKFDYEKFKK